MSKASRRGRRMTAALAHAMAIVGFALLAVPGGAMAAELNLTGGWSTNYHCEVGGCAGMDFPSTVTLSQASGSEEVTGSNGSEAITGTLSGTTFTYISKVGSYEAHGTVTLSTDGKTWSGPSHDSNGTSGTETATRLGDVSGALSQLPSPFNCVSDSSTGDLGCGTLIPGGLSAAYEPQVSPDGRNVYAVAINGALTEFSRNQDTGALSAIGCVSSGKEECAAVNETLEAHGMENPAALAVSPDGQSVYVVAQGFSALVSFARDPVTGLLAETGCISHNSGSGCAIEDVKGLNLPYGVAISPDSENVYTAAFSDEAIDVFHRDPATGALTQLAEPAGCISGSALSGCSDDEAAGLEKALGVTVSPDGKNVYLAAGGTEGGGDIAEFARNTAAEGALTPLASACLTSAAVSGCGAANHIDGPEDLAVSPDGRNLYANSFSNSALIEMARDAVSGALSQLPSPSECISSEVITGCTQVSGIGGTLGVAVSPGGSNVYVDGAGAKAIASFSRDPNSGSLVPLPAPFECITENATGCSAIDAVGLEGARRLTVSPDGANVYVAAQPAAALTEFARVATPTVTSITPNGGAQAGGTTVTIGGFEFAVKSTVAFGATQAANVTVNSAYSITAVSPPGSGTVDVRVTSASATSPIVAADQFTYTAPVSPLPIIGPVQPQPLLVPAPVLAKRGNIAPVSGRVLVRVPGSNRFVPVSELEQVPFGAVIEATHGKVSVTVATPRGGTQTGQFFDGQFKLTQGKNGLVLATLTGGDFSVCGHPVRAARSTFARSSSSHASGKHVVRKLWANAHGSFSTKGNYAAGAVQGTEWLTADLCEGTLIRVTRDKVKVTDLVRHRHIEVRAGHRYLAKPK